jgi:primosomal protein N' (replication factor Y)
MNSSPSLLSVAIPPVDGEYLYSYPALLAPPRIGDRLEVPFGRRSTTAYVLSVNSPREEAAQLAMIAKNISIKEISSEAEPICSFHPEQLEFFEWMARYHAEPLSKILDLAIPGFAEGRAESLVELADGDVTSLKLGPSQARLVAHLQSVGGAALLSELRHDFKNLGGVVKSLEERGILRRFAHKAPSNSDIQASNILRDAKLTEAQQDATDAIVHSIRHGEFHSFLLYGVTGSGKTEVYIEAIHAALQRGKSSLLVVPEIALTPQLIQRFEARLDTPIAVLHSSLKAKDRWSNWARLLRGECKIAIGARSAIFAPVTNLGLVVVDEEHDSSFKQGEGIRYHGRDLAIVRAKLARCPIVLGSATPSLETYHHAVRKKHSLLELPARFFTSKRLTYKVIDLNKIKPWVMPSKSITKEFLHVLEQTLERGDQAFVLYNRRGFATYLQCSHCEYVLECPHCSVTLTYHQRPNSLLCHFCGYSSAPLLVCPSCKKTDDLGRIDSNKLEPLFVNRGAGTERVFEELQSLLPKARLGKLDRDAVQSLQDYTTILGKVRSKEIDILVGTQMIAKGHDLPDVTLVGIVDCDIGLHVPDFRASERVFQLLTQASGRAGRRDKQGQVVLQTRLPDHPSLQMTAKEDYLQFANLELVARRDMGYPPFKRLLRIIVSAEEKADARNNAALLAQVAHSLAGRHTITVLGPAPAPIEKIRRHWRYHLLCKGESAPHLQAFMHSIRSSFSAGRNIRITFDMDPQDML